jgi:hypothetical protein
LDVVNAKLAELGVKLAEVTDKFKGLTGGLGLC